ncbi:tyrosine-type recombinase/integrase [Streptomyces sp. NPDC059262]|uniref:tyrosine-type recombinase/integrase n=1 Tax=Streptomyces sp. NPDC059262 TaxID=3346797 RepID=UPI003675281F
MRARPAPGAHTALRPTSRDFTSRSGEPLHVANLRRDVKAIVKKAGAAAEWAPRELRHSFVTLLCDRGIPTQGAQGTDEIFAQRREPTAREA